MVIPIPVRIKLIVKMVSDKLYTDTNSVLPSWRSRVMPSGMKNIIAKTPP